MSAHIRIDGTLTTLSPLHISSPEKGLRYNPQTRNFVYDGSGSPCTPTRTQRFFHPDFKNEKNFSGIEKFPVIPASSLRGRLRREAAREIEEFIVHEKAERLSWQAYQVMHSGAVTGNPETGVAGLDEIRAARSHVFMGLFGGGIRMLPGTLAVESGLPLIEELFEMGIIPDDLRSTRLISAGTAWSLMEALPVVRGDDLVQFRDPNAETIVENYEEVMLEQLDSIAKAKLKRRQGAADDDSEDDKEPRGLRTLAFQQVVVSGVPFYVAFQSRGTKAQAGLLIIALLRMLSAENSVGGGAALGFGRVAHELYLHMEGKRVRLFTGQGAATQLNRSESIIGDLVAAAEEAINAIDANSLNQLALA